MNTNQFSTATLISAGTGILMPENTGEGFAEMYRICEYMSGETGLYTHQLPRISGEIAPYLTEQFPWLAEVATDWENTPKPSAKEPLYRFCNDLVAKMTALYGDLHEVIPMHQEDHTSLDWETELLMMVPEKRIFTIDPETGDLTNGLPDDEPPEDTDPM